MTETALLALLFFGAATLYSSVGHAGASGYLAVMALAGMSPDVMKPTALLLNIIVASIATVRFARASYFSWAVFWPFALSSIPFAALGCAIAVPAPLYSVGLGIILLLAAYRVFFFTDAVATIRRPLPLLAGMTWGAGMGFVSGLTGIGGGILLSPLLMLAGWADARKSAGVAAAFVLVNSVAGIVGHIGAAGWLPRTIVPWAIAAAMGGFVGSGLGVRQFAEVTLRRLLAGVLALAGLKLIFAPR